MLKIRIIFVLVIALAIGATQTFSQSWTDKSPHTEGFVTANGVKLEYLDWGGKGEALVFLTGMGATPHIFDDLAPKFKDKFRVVSYTRRGMYKSDKPASGYDTATLTEDLRGFLDALKIQKATLVGWSLAGTEMTRFAVAYPERVSALVYLDSAYDYGSLFPIFEKDTISANPTKEDLASWDAAKIWFVKVYDFWSDAVEADARAVNLQPDGTMKLQVMSDEITAQMFNGMKEAKPDFSKVKAPVLAFFAVSRDHPFLSSAKNDEERAKGSAFWKNQFAPHVEQQIARLKKDLPSAKIVRLEESKHLCFIKKEHEAQIVKEMNSFLKD